MRGWYIGIRGFGSLELLDLPRPNTAADGALDAESIIPIGLYGSRVDEVPYFSMFPPVYYSMPVPRTYGWSPFAYPPGTMTPEVAADGPEDIINPYVPQNKEAKPAKPTSARTAAFHPHTPQMLVNQFVSAEGTTQPASTQIARK